MPSHSMASYIWRAELNIPNPGAKPMSLNTTLDCFYVGQRIQLHPATDAWMAGDRYGEIVKLGRTRVHIRMDRSGLVRLIAPVNVLEIDQ